MSNELSNGYSLPIKLRSSAGGYVMVTIFSVLFLGLFAGSGLTQSDASRGWGIMLFIVGVMLFLYFCLWRLQLSADSQAIRYRSLLRRFEIPFSSIGKIEFVAPKKWTPGSGTGRICTMKVYRARDAGEPLTIAVKAYSRRGVATFVRYLETTELPVKVGRHFAARAFK